MTKTKEEYIEKIHELFHNTILTLLKNDNVRNAEEIMKIKDTIPILTVANIVYDTKLYFTIYNALYKLLQNEIHCQYYIINTEIIMEYLEETREYLIKQMEEETI